MLHRQIPIPFSNGLHSRRAVLRMCTLRLVQGMSRFEGFIRGKMLGYRAQLQVFQSANEELIRQAQKDNVEGAALAFTQLTISCVNCHKQLREGPPNRLPPLPSEFKP